MIQRQVFGDLSQCQAAFESWRTVYNTERPHQAIGMAVPASRYRVSPRPWPKLLPQPCYHPDDIVRKVQQGGEVSFKGKTIDLPSAFVGQHVGFRSAHTDGLWDVFFAANLIAQVDLRDQIRQP